MEKLMEMARKVADQVEIFSNDGANNKVVFRGGKLKDVDSGFDSGVSIRIIRDGKLGFAYTKNLIDRQELIDNAVKSLEGNVEADYDFAKPREYADLDTYDKSIESLENTALLQEVNRIRSKLEGNTSCEISVFTASGTGSDRVMTSHGVDVSTKDSACYVGGHLIFPGGAAGIGRMSMDKKFNEMAPEKIEELLRIANAGEKVVEPKGGRMKVLFMPGSMLLMAWRISSGLNSVSVYQGISPIKDKVGEKIFGNNITIIDDPHNTEFPGARAFDDEGTATAKRLLVENGILRGFYYDLKYGSKLDHSSTGNGYRSAMWGGETISMQPAPSLKHAYIKPGDKSIAEMIGMIDRGIILEGAMGAHSGNIPNGDYSVGVSPALYVENGEIVGRIKDTMVAGNIYENLKNVIAIENKLTPSGMGKTPALLCDEVNVATKG